jgi:vacuolar-type H+-ATPase subunit C/Vma6
LGEINDDLVPDFMDPLLEKYGLENIKWIVTNPKK